MDEFVVRRPHPSLRGLVTRYIGYRQHNVTLPLHRGLPSRHVTLIISLDLPVRIVGMPSRDQSPTSLRGLVGGMHTSPALIAQDATQAGIHLELNPLGTRTLLGMPAAGLSGYVVDLADLGSPALAHLPERLATAPDWVRRFAILDDVLRSAAGEAVSTLPELRWAWRGLIGARGTVRIESLAGEIGWSRRYFTERFRREVGLSPKQVARVLRFEHACARLRSGAATSLAELAVDCGYYDQAHLTNEWHALAGCTPGTWIAEELPFLQYDGQESHEGSRA